MCDQSLPGPIKSLTFFRHTAYVHTTNVVVIYLAQVLLRQKCIFDVTKSQAIVRTKYLSCRPNYFEEN